MPIQAPQWTDFKLCPICQNEFNSVQRLPVSLGCGHSICQSCLLRLSRQQCPFDMAEIQIEISKLPVNYALLSLVGGSIPDTFPVDVPDVCQNRKHFDSARMSIEYLAQFLQNCSTTGNGSSSASANGGMTRPMQRKLITLIHSQLAEVEGRCRAVRAARSIGERAVKELILMHQSPQTLSATLWAAVRQRGCQFLGPAMQEAVLQLILLTLEDGVPLSRKVLVLYVVQKLETQFTQASKTSIGHVVQLLYRASCFKVTKREGDSSLLQLHEKYRTYTALRKEHDAQIVNIASEAGLHISPEQWSALLYGDDEHKSHMQSIIDKLQTPASFGSSIQELIIALQRTNDPHNLQDLRPHLELLSRLDPANEAPAPTWQQLEDAMQSLKLVMCGLHSFARDYAAKNRGNIEGAQMINTKYRTSMCRDIVNRNNCPRGANCNFAHSEEELERYRKRRHVPGSGVRPPVNSAVTMTASNISAAHSLRSGSSSSPDSIDTDDLDADFHGDEQMMNDAMTNDYQASSALAPATGVSFRPVVPAASSPGGIYHPSHQASQHVGMLSEGLKAVSVTPALLAYSDQYQQPSARRNLATPATGFRPVVTAASNPGGMYHTNHHVSQQVDIISDGLKSMSVSSARPAYGDQFQQPAVRRSLSNGMVKYQAPYAYCEVAPQSPVPIYVTQASQPSYIGTCAAPMYQPQMSHPLYQYPTEVFSGNPCHQMYSVPAAFPRYAVARSCEVEDESSSELSLKIPSEKDDAKDDWKFGVSSRSRGESYRDFGRCSSLGYSSDTFSPLSSSSTGSRASPPSGQGASSGVWDSLFPNEQSSIWAPQPSKLSNWTIGATSPSAAPGIGAAASGSRPRLMDWENMGARNPARKEEVNEPLGRAKDLLGASAKSNDHAFDDWKSWSREERKNVNSNQSLLREMFPPSSRPSYGFGFI